MYRLPEIWELEVEGQETFLRGALEGQLYLAGVKRGLILALSIEVCAETIPIFGERSELTPPLTLESTFPPEAAVRTPPQPCGDQRT